MSKMKSKAAKSKTVVEDVDVAIKNKKTLDMKDNKSNAMSTAITLIAAMSGDEINKLLPVLQQNSQSAAASIPDDAAAKNAASIAMKGAVTEELNVIFGGETLTEEFKERITVLFESAVAAKVAVELAEKEEHFDKLLTEQSAQLVEELTDNVDRYLSYVAEEWMKENEIAIESGIRTELAEQFMLGLKELFRQHYIEVPDEKIDVVEKLSEQVEALQEQLNEALAAKISIEEELAQSVMEDVFENVSEGLALTEVEKFRTLAEGVDFEGDVDAYSKKLNIIKEKHFNKKSTSSTKSLVLNESIETSDDVKPIDNTVAKYAEMIHRTVKK